MFGLDAGEKLYARAIATGEDPREDDCAELQRQEHTFPLEMPHCPLKMAGLTFDAQLPYAKDLCVVYCKASYCALCRHIAVRNMSMEEERQQRVAAELQKGGLQQHPTSCCRNLLVSAVFHHVCFHTTSSS